MKDKLNFDFLRVRHESNRREEAVLEKMMKIKKDLKSLIKDLATVPPMVIHAKIDLYNFWANLVGEGEISFKGIVENNEWPPVTVDDFLLDWQVAIVVPSREEATAIEDLTKIFYSNITVFIGAHSLVTGLLACDKKYIGIISLRSSEVDDGLVRPIKDIVLVSLGIFSGYDENKIKWVTRNLPECMDEIYTGPFHLLKLIENCLARER